ncbi:MAG: GlsB/YeaQ/YmgE family stress response membrane protein [bacterium]
MEGLVWWLIVGLVAGWLTGKVMRGKGYGVVGDIVIGILGALIGGWLFGKLGYVATGMITQIIVAFLGAVILVAVLRVLKKT